MPGIGSVGPWEIILILAILLLVFGAKRLPEIGSALGKGIREFKGSVRDIESEFKTPHDRPRSELPRTEAPRADSPAPDAPRAEARAGEAPPESAPVNAAGESTRRDSENRPAGSSE